MSTFVQVNKEAGNKAHNKGGRHGLETDVSYNTARQHQTGASILVEYIYISAASNGRFNSGRINGHARQDP